MIQIISCGSTPAYDYTDPDNPFQSGWYFGTHVYQGNGGGMCHRCGQWVGSQFIQEYETCGENEIKPNLIVNS